jgi:hypothetical protein
LAGHPAEAGLSNQSLKWTYNISMTNASGAAMIMQNKIVAIMIIYTPEKSRNISE